MIPWSGTKKDELLKLVAKRVTDSDRIGGHESVYFPEDEEAYLTYLGHGYWRAIVCQRGIRLVNPDCTIEEINTVEKAVCIILRLTDKWEMYSKE